MLIFGHSSKRIFCEFLKTGPDFPLIVSHFIRSNNRLPGKKTEKTSIFVSKIRTDCCKKRTKLAKTVQFRHKDVSRFQMSGPFPDAGGAAKFPVVRCCRIWYNIRRRARLARRGHKPPRPGKS